jgi:hypothetical protein
MKVREISVQVNKTVPMKHSYSSIKVGLTATATLDPKEDMQGAAQVLFTDLSDQVDDLIYQALQEEEEE